MEKQLPIYEIEGTPFTVDIEKSELRQVDNPANTIGFFSDMTYRGTHYQVQYELLQKKVQEGWSDTTRIRVINIPQMIVLDPEGMAAKHNIPVAELKDKRDFEVIVNQDLYNRRLNGHLPVIDIMGHPFFVDLRMGSLRPKDDFSTTGIEFSQIEGYVNPDEQKYWVPYAPTSHSFRDIDSETILSVPKDIFVIEIPTAQKLDPVGYARLHGFDIEDIVLANPIKSNMKAKIIPWTETEIQKVIKENQKKAIQTGMTNPMENKSAKANNKQSKQQVTGNKKRRGKSL